MSDYTTLSDVLHDLLLDHDSDVAAMMDRHLSPDYQHSVNGTWSTRAEFEALVRRLRQTITGGTIRVHEELRQGTTYAERHTLELTMSDGNKEKAEAFAIGEYAPDGRFLRLYEATFSATADSALSRPPFDPELDAILAMMDNQIPTITPELIPALRQMPLPIDVSDEPLRAVGVTRRDITIQGYEGAELVASVIARSDHASIGPGIYHVHGGGMIAGERMIGVGQILPWIIEHDAVAVTIDYRLAPEFPDPYPVEDCYAGLLWTADHAVELGIDLDRLIIAGGSAGGGLAAGTALIARDRKGPKLAGQVLIYPMLDDRDQTVSTEQYDGFGLWNRESNLTGWNALLGDRRGTDHVSIYAAPARATDLSGLPPAFIDCGSAELFRDEDVAYATALWHSGVQAELHVWPGGFHGFDMVAPHTPLAQAATAARNAWVARLLGT